MSVLHAFDLQCCWAASVVISVCSLLQLTAAALANSKVKLGISHAAYIHRPAFPPFPHRLDSVSNLNSNSGNNVNALRTRDMIKTNTV